MIYANELRVGNWVSDFGVNKKVGSGDIMYLDGEDDTDFGDMYFGIPLTPEILEKCGFEFDGAGFTQKYKLERKWRMTLFIISDTVKWTLNRYTSFEIKSVHQLQNLYFALTGEELTIDINPRK